MTIVYAIIASILVKGISAIVEIAIQLVIANGIGISGYGDYTFYVSLIEFLYFLFFSGISKVNSYYLSSKNIQINNFRKKYILFYLIPICILVELLGVILSNQYVFISGLILPIYFLAIDATSRGIAQGKESQSLTGEYLIGRVLMLFLLIVGMKIDILSGSVLLVLYGLQYASIFVWMLLINKDSQNKTVETTVSLNKVWKFQESDIASSIVFYSPTILQYVFNGAVDTGFMGTISVARRFINFISGPAAKVFLPEFSRLYNNGDREGLKKTYCMIVKVQMVFISLIGTLLVVFNKLFLSLFSPELFNYANLFAMISICLLVTASVGPVNGFLLMTGNEKKCIWIQWLSIACMIISWILLRGSTNYFVIFGLCIQCLVYTFGGYFVIISWFKQNILPLKQMLPLFFLLFINKIIVLYFNMEFSWSVMCISALVNLTICVIVAIQDPIVANALNTVLKRK